MFRSLMIVSLTFLSLQANAYYSVMDTGEIMESGRYKVTPELQFLTSDGGANVGADIDMGLNEDTGLRGQVGFGTTDFYLGAFFKYMPFPDVDNQPAIGFNLGGVYARDAGDADFTVRFEPLISKKFGADFGAITPYASLPLAVQHRSAEKYAHDHNNFLMQLAFGTQVDLKSLDNIGLLAEVGIDLNKAFSYISFGAAWYFGEQTSKKVSMNMPPPRTM
jgi:hypothetical protein